MRIEFDPAKDARNVRERGLSLARFADMRADSMVTRPDLRRDYGEKRLRVFGILDERLHVAVITWRNDSVRVISLRIASRRERSRHAKETSSAR